MRANVELNIEELVLHGFSPGDRLRIGDAVQRELVRLFSEQGVSPSFVREADTEKVDGGSFHVASGSRVEVVGAQVARSVYGGLTR